jgi:uncharacterized protein YciI
VSHHLLLYDYVEDYVERRAPFRERHLALARQAHDRGELVMAGALADSPPGAVFVFSVDEPSAVEAFVEVDPYVQGGVVTSWRVRPWNVVVGG